MTMIPRLKFFLVSISALLLLSVPARADLSAKSADPAKDEAAYAQMRARMDSLRRTEVRPTVALVLSGGGAKGAAHAGVLRYLEELGIPVDMVLGTSMGGLMGGLYALGHSPEAIERLLRETDWSEMLSDNVPTEYISMSTKEYRDKYALRIPFKYEEADFTRRIGASSYEEVKSLNRLLGSVPAGYITGLNVNNILSSMSVGYQDERDFKTLPIPFFCVATDLVSGTAYNWTDGNIVEAMRSTMSIPGLFSPLRTDGMILIDGGMRNNFPTDIAREMGADIVIGVTLYNDDKTFSEINSLPDLLMPMIDMLGRETFEKNLELPDVLIHPDMTGYNMLSFSSKNISDLIERGYETARLHYAELDKIKQECGGAYRRNYDYSARDISQVPVQIRTIEFEGLTDKESRFLSTKLRFSVGDFITKEDVDGATAEFYASGAFNSVTYKLLGDSMPYRLVFCFEKGPVNILGIGFRADTEELVDIVLNVGLNANKLSGSRFSLTGRVGQNKSIALGYALDLPSIPTVNADANFKWVTVPILGEGRTKSMFNYFSHREQIFLSNMQWKKFDVRGGIANTGYAPLALFPNYSSNVPASDILAMDGNYISAFIDARANTQDSKYYPTRGLNVRLKYEPTLFSTDKSLQSPMHEVCIDFQNVFNLADPFALIFDIHSRNVFNSSGNLAHRNFIGGSLPGRYFDQQLTFCGINSVYLASDHLLSAQLDFRWNVIKNLFASLKGGMMKESESLREEFTTSTGCYFGAAFEVGYNTIVGPIKANVHWSNLTNRAGVYVSLGFDF